MFKMFDWPVVPLCEAQLQDVNPADILGNGLYRKCNTYKGGGGYDQFPSIYIKRFGEQSNLHLNDQFVVQVSGCPLHCPYCYVTDAGIRGKSVAKTTAELVDAFYRSGCSVFHLMGGAPALYLNQWWRILRHLDREYVFHSDLLLLEGEYDEEVLRDIAQYPNSLYAVSIKGATAEEYLKNTATEIDMALLWRNLDRLVNAGIPFYVTFTGMSIESIERFRGEVVSRYGDDAILTDSFAISLVHYKALDWTGSI